MAKSASVKLRTINNVTPALIKALIVFIELFWKDQIEFCKRIAMGDMKEYDDSKKYKVGDKFVGTDGITREVIKSCSNEPFKCAHCEAKKFGCTWRYNNKVNGLYVDAICSIKKLI